MQRDRLAVFRDHGEPFERRVLNALDLIITLLIEQGVITHMDLTQLQNDVAAETTVNQSAITLLNQLAQEIRDAAGDPAALAALASSIEENTQALSDAVTANTPASGADTGQQTGAGGTQSA